METKILHRGTWKTPAEVIAWCVNEININPAILDDDKDEVRAAKVRENSRLRRLKLKAEDPDGFRKKCSAYSRAYRNRNK